MRPDEEPRPSWICHNEFERARFMDLHARLLRANHAILLMLIVAIAFALPFVSGRLGVIPAAAGIVLFSAIQRNAKAFARPELWVFGALLGGEGLIALAIAAQGGGTTPAMALLCWPVAGLAGRFPNRASRIGTAYALALVSAVVLIGDSDFVANDPFALSLGHSHSVAKRGLVWIVVMRSGTSPVFSKRCGVPGGTITISPARTTRSSPSAVNVAVPAWTMKSSW